MSIFARIRASIQQIADRIAVALADRTPRERILLYVLAGTGVLALIYLAIWQPLERTRENYAVAIERQDLLTARVKAMDNGAAPATPARDPRPTAVIVSDTAAAAALSIRRLEPVGEDARVVLEDAEFGAVLTWLDSLDREEGLRVAEIDISRRPEPGLISTTLMLRR